jgi:hypothetical protein
MAKVGAARKTSRKSRAPLWAAVTCEGLLADGTLHLALAPNGASYAACGPPAVAHEPPTAEWPLISALQQTPPYKLYNRVADYRF